MTDEGGAIRKPTVKPTVTDVRRIQMENRLMTEDQYDTDTDTDDDEEAGAYSHLGGQLSGKGAAYDPPHVAQSVIKSLQAYPEILAAYTQGRVSNPPGSRYDGFQEFAQRDAGASIIDYGGSIDGVTHSENGYLVAHDSSFPHEFHIV